MTIARSFLFGTSIQAKAAVLAWMLVLTFPSAHCVADTVANALAEEAAHASSSLATVIFSATNKGYFDPCPT